MSKSRKQIQDEMTGLLLKGGLIGVVAFGIAVAFMVVPRQLGKIWPTTAEQTGFRGTGMEVIAFDSDAAALAMDNQLPGMSEPIPPEPGEPLARDVYPNSEPLGHLTARNYERLVAAMREWVGNDTLFSEEETYATGVARNMIEMVWAINQNWDGHVAATGVTCYTCHRGNAVPENHWFLPTPHGDWAGPSAAMQNRAVPANYSTALPIDALKTYLLETDQEVVVHGYASRDEDGSSNASIYHTYQTYALMMHFASSLGVNCTYCHNTRAPADPAGFTPQWATAQIGRSMVQEINNDHLPPNLGLLPAERLGPSGDVAKASCATCHQGVAKPLLGQSMLASWPELVGPEPVYE